MAEDQTQAVQGHIRDVLNDLADALETGKMGDRPKIGLTINGSENGFEVMKEAVRIASQKDVFDIVTIGEAQDWTADYEHYEASTEDETSETLQELLDNNTIQGVVTLHHTFPIGVSTVGRVPAQASGNKMYIATTTGTTATVRAEAMVLNAINGIVAAKASGVENPTVGILNVDDANTVARKLQELKDNGFQFEFAESARADGGNKLRGNDLILGSADVVVTDSLTGNILMKLYGAGASGGKYEVVGDGYGPGIGDGFKDNICIISRASGAPVIANAMEYAYQLAVGNLAQVSADEYAKAKKAGLDDIREDLQPKAAAAGEGDAEEIEAPEHEVVDSEIPGVDVLDLDAAVQSLWKEGIYAESGMGCSGPIVLVANDKEDKARDIIADNGFI